MTRTVEVHVRHPLDTHPGCNKSPRFVSPEAAASMVAAGRAVYPGDPSTPNVYENGAPRKGPK